MIGVLPVPTSSRQRCSAPTHFMSGQVLSASRGRCCRGTETSSTLADDDVAHAPTVSEAHRWPSALRSSTAPVECPAGLQCCALLLRGVRLRDDSRHLTPVAAHDDRRTVLHVVDVAVEPRFEFLKAHLPFWHLVFPVVVSILPSRCPYASVVPAVRSSVGAGRDIVNSSPARGTRDRPARRAAPAPGRTPESAPAPAPGPGRTGRAHLPVAHVRLELPSLFLVERQRDLLVLTLVEIELLDDALALPAERLAQIARFPLSPLAQPARRQRAGARQESEGIHSGV